MNAEKKLIQNGFIEPSYRFDKYRKYLDTIFDIVVDGGYINKVISVEKNNPNLGHKDTKEFCVFRIKGDQKANFEKIMQDLNIFLFKENLEKDGTMHEWFVFKSENLPELRAIIRGCVKIKMQESKIAIEPHYRWFFMEKMAERTDR